MPRKPRTPKGRRPTRTAEMTFDQRDELLFRWSLLGEPGWVDEDHRRECWFRHREELMADRPLGERPFGWWLYEARSRPLAIYGCQGVLPVWEETEAGALQRLGELTAEESALLAAGQLEAWEETFRPVDPDPEPPFYVLQDDYEAAQRTLKVPGDGMLCTADRVLGTLREAGEAWAATCAACAAPHGPDHGTGTHTTPQEAAERLAGHWLEAHDYRRRS